MSYIKDVDILLVKSSDEPIEYAEDSDQFIVHFSKEGKPVLLGIQYTKEFVLESLGTLFLRETRCFNESQAN
jgi:hypothetical protein